MARKKLGALLVGFSALGFGTIAIFVKVAYSQGVNASTMLAGRFTLAAIIVWGAILFSRLPYRVRLHDWKQLAVVSLLGYGGGSTLFFLSVNLLPASLASMLLYTYPVMVALAETVFFKQPVTRAKAAALLLSSIGLGLLLGVNFKGVNMLGAALALGAAVCYTAYLIYGKRTTQDHPPLVTSGYIITFAALGYLLYAVLWGSLSLDFGPLGWWSIIGLALLGTALAIFALFAGMQWLTPSGVAIISTIEPVFTVVCAMLLFHEAVLPLQMLGGAMVLGAIIIIARDEK